MICLSPPVISPMLHLLGALFQGSASHQEANLFCSLCKAEVSEVCFWPALLTVCSLDECGRNKEQISCFLLWGVRRIFPVLRVFHLGSV